MHINLSARDPQNFQAEVVLGETFSFGTDLKDPHWLKEVNGVLRINQSNGKAILQAIKPGSAQVLLFDESFSLIRKLDITVVLVISDFQN